MIGRWLETPGSSWEGRFSIHPSVEDFVFNRSMLYTCCHSLHDQDLTPPSLRYTVFSTYSHILMAELGAAIIGGAFALGAVWFTTGTGFAARHENTHALQVAEMNRLFLEFETAYKREEVTEHDWKQFLAIRDE